MSAHPIERHCPKCHALIGVACRGPRGKVRKSFHRERGVRQIIKAATDHGKRTESPIEAGLLSFILGWLDHHEVFGWEVSTQVPVGPYRADIIVEAPSGKWLAVEADGAQYHNTKEAVARDKRRDRYFAIQGVAVMRFTGAEINRDPRGCAAQIGLWIRANQ